MQIKHCIHNKSSFKKCSEVPLPTVKSLTDSHLEFKVSEKMSCSYHRVLILLFAVPLSAFQWDKFRKRDKAGVSTGPSE